jgi:hypothetical protein
MARTLDAKKLKRPIARRQKFASPPEIVRLEEREVIQYYAARRGKISDALMKLARPLLDEAQPTTVEQAQDVIALAALAWNVAVLDDPDEYSKAVAGLRVAENGKASERTLALLVSRKRELFPDDDRMVINFEVQIAGDGLRLLAASAVTGR